jgi:hypothetical protein
MPLRLLLALSLLAPTLTLAADPAPADPDFKPLFNSKDLAGWTPVNLAPNTFTNKGDHLYCTGVPTGVLRSDKMYENFVVELEWRHLTPGGNAGFFVWSDALTAPGQPFTRAVEIQVLDGPNHPDRRYTTHGDVFPIHGATLIPDNPFKTAKPGISGRSYPTEDRSKPSPEWNHYRIECIDGKISLAVNGKVVTTGHSASPRKGHLCLESEGGQVEWRNLKIKELPPTTDLDPKHVAAGPDGYTSLYTGLDLTNWTTSDAAKPLWQPKDWTLHFDPIKSNPPIDPTLRTLATYAGDLDLMLDLRTASPLTLTLRGATMTIEPPADTKRPTWRRLHLTARDNTLAPTLDGKPLPPLPTTPAPTPLTLHPSGPTDLANLYLRQPK